MRNDTSESTMTDIAALRELLEKATKGPWRLRLTDLERPDYAEIDGDRHGALATVVYRMEDDKRFGKNSPENEANAALIVAAFPKPAEHAPKEPPHD